MRKSDILDLLEIILQAIRLIGERYAEIEESNLSSLSPRAVVILDSIAMRLLLIGEKIKSIEQKSPGLLAQHGIDARPIIRTRDFLSHHYEDIDFEAIMLICKTNLPDLEIKVKSMMEAG